MKSLLKIVPAVGLALFCAACNSVKPVEEYYIQDLSDNQQKVILNSKTACTISGQDNDLKLLLHETGLDSEYAEIRSKSAPVFRRFYCKVDDDGNVGWRFSKQDSLMNAARVIRNLESKSRKKAYAAKLAQIWMSGNDYTAQIFYEQALREMNPSCFLVRESQKEESVSPAAIREGYYVVDKESGKEIFVRHGLQREFAEDGCLIRETVWKNGKKIKQNFVVSEYCKD